MAGLGVSIDFKELSAENERSAALRRLVKAMAKRKVREVAFTAKRNVQVMMPVDTGRARASWGNVPAPAPAQPDDGIWEEADDGLTITQGTNVEYVQALNEGSSKQAPAGFIDVVALLARDALDIELARELVYVLTGEVLF